ncbi:cadmium-induced protein AS8-like isoform X2 [Salvia divinorum]|uniref:Cadmium-induced protein AS8-like isoform X2 n=1 Tax=Salvia divinorum TaxID=28513 RepID=A0ABD1H971_SALDI
MLIKGLFGRYERWNPVHPTIGAFWGVGIGIGCGVGWGPGFGHEVVGYVGAGCGAGFNVGITFLGVGIGLPANYLSRAPHSALVVAKKGSLEESLTGSRSAMEDGWDTNSSDISGTEQSRGASFSGFKVDSLKENLRDLPDVRSVLASHTKHVTDCLHRVSAGLIPLDKGT